MNKPISFRPVRIDTGMFIEIFDSLSGRPIDYAPIYPSDMDIESIMHASRVAFAEWQESGDINRPYHAWRFVALVPLALLVWGFIVWAITGV